MGRLVAGFLGVLLFIALAVLFGGLVVWVAFMLLHGVVPQVPRLSLFWQSIAVSVAADLLASLFRKAS